MVSKTAQRVEEKLKTVFQPTEFELIDNSWKHAGHAGNTMGGSHLALRIVSTAFEGVNRLKRHRMVHDCLREELAGPVHALELDLQAVSEV